MARLEGLEGMTFDDIMPQVNPSVFPGGRGVITLPSGRT